MHFLPNVFTNKNRHHSETSHYRNCFMSIFQTTQKLRSTDSKTINITIVCNLKPKLTYSQLVLQMKTNKHSETSYLKSVLCLQCSFKINRQTEAMAMSCVYSSPTTQKLRSRVNGRQKQSLGPPESMNLFYMIYQNKPDKQKQLDMSDVYTSTSTQNLKQ